MTLKEFGDRAVKQILNSSITLMLLFIIAAFKAPFVFKKNVETELSSKADQSEIERLDKEKVGHTEFDQYKITEREMLDAKYDALDGKMDVLLDYWGLLYKEPNKGK